MTSSPDQSTLDRIRSDGITIQVPCSTSNFGPGFDCLGAALDRFLTVHVQPGKNELSLSYLGGYQPDVPDEENLILTSLRTIAKQRGTTIPPLDIQVESEIPPGGGLGSSAAAIAAGGALGQLIATGTVNRERLFEFGYQCEGHPDNIAPAVFGGVTLAYLVEDDAARCEQIATDLPDLFLVDPDVQINTQEAREILPDELPRSDAVFNLTRTGLLVHAFKDERIDLLDEAMQDRIHQPYRAELLPGGTAVLDAGREAGALGVWISGAGPAIGCFVRDGDREPARAMAEVLEENGATAEVSPAELCVPGLHTSL
jgi:homoserine kinase